TFGSRRRRPRFWRGPSPHPDWSHHAVRAVRANLARWWTAAVHLSTNSFARREVSDRRREKLHGACWRPLSGAGALVFFARAIVWSLPPAHWPIRFPRSVRAISL